MCFLFCLFSLFVCGGEQQKRLLLLLCVVCCVVVGLRFGGHLGMIEGFVYVCTCIAACASAHACVFPSPVPLSSPRNVPRSSQPPDNTTEIMKTNLLHQL